MAAFRGPSLTQKFGRGTGLQFISAPDEEVIDAYFGPGASATNPFGTGVFGRLPTFGNEALEPEEATHRGGRHERVELEDDLPAIASPCDNLDDLLALDEALDQLAQALALVALGHGALEAAEAWLADPSKDRAVAARRWT